MGRTVYTLKVQPGDAARIIQKMSETITLDGYNLIDYNGEPGVFKKGIGMAQAMQFISLVATEDTVIVSGWVCAGIGSATMKEMELKGFVGSLPKRGVKKEIEKAFESAGVAKPPKE